MRLFRVLSRNFQHPATISRPSSVLFGTNSSLCLLGGMKNGGIMRLSLCVRKWSSRNSWRDYAAVSRPLVQYDLAAYAAITRTIFLPARMCGYFPCAIVRGYQFKRLFLLSCENTRLCPLQDRSQQCRNVLIFIFGQRAAMPQCLVISRAG
jgi:hypothetical protein